MQGDVKVDCDVGNGRVGNEQKLRIARYRLSHSRAVYARGISVIRSWKIQRYARPRLRSLVTLHLQTTPSACLSSQSYRELGVARRHRTQKRLLLFSPSTTRRSHCRNVITGALNLFEVHCKVRHDAAEVLMATRDSPTTRTEACLHLRLFLPVAGCCATRLYTGCFS